MALSVLLFCQCGPNSLPNDKTQSKRRRGFSSKQPPATDSTAASPTRDLSRDNQLTSSGRVLPNPWLPAPRGRGRGSRAAPSRSSRATDPSRPVLVDHATVGSINSPRLPPRGCPLDVSSGSFGPLGVLDTPSSDGACGLQSNYTPGLLGSAPVVGLPHVSSSSSGLVVLGDLCGAGLPEASPSTSPTNGVPAASSVPENVVSSPKADVRKGKVLAKAPSSRKAKRFRKAKGRAVLRIFDEDTSDDDQRADDRIMNLIERGFDMEEIDRLYCRDELSAGEVERIL